MTRNPRNHNAGNQGIQATNVQAEVLAVGQGAQAVKHAAAADAEVLAKAVGQLRVAIAGLGLQPAARAVLERDVEGLAEATRSHRPDVHPDVHKAESHLKGMAEKLKMVGIVVKEVAGLAEPVSKIATLLRIPLTFLTG